MFSLLDDALSQCINKNVQGPLNHKYIMYKKAAGSWWMWTTFKKPETGGKEGIFVEKSRKSKLSNSVTAFIS